MSNDDQLASLLKEHAAHLTVSAELRERILSSAPGQVRTLHAVLRDARRLPVPAALSQRILAAAPYGGWRDLVASLWPFGPVWRPAAALLAVAAISILLGTTDAANLVDDVSVNGALSEEVYALAFVSGGFRAPGDLEWPE